MSTQASAKLAPFLAGPETTSLPAPGDDGWYPLASVAEPISAGQPPVRPALIAQVTMTPPAVRTQDAAGYAHAYATATAGRATATVEWTGLNDAQRTALAAFLREDCGVTERPMDVEVDGPGSGTSKLRPMAPAVERALSKGVWSITVECEEVA